MLETNLLSKAKAKNSRLVLGIIPSSTQRTLSMYALGCSFSCSTDLQGSDPKVFNASDTATSIISLPVPAGAGELIFSDFVKRTTNAYIGTNANIENSIIKSVIDWDDYPLSRLSLRDSKELVSVPEKLFKACRSLNAMLQLCYKFESDVSAWDVSEVTSLTYLFANTRVFNSSIENWVINPKADLLGILRAAEGFNQPMNNFDISGQTSLDSFFYSCKLFNQPLDRWDISRVNNISNFMGHSTKFNQNLSNWVFQPGTKKDYYDNGATSWIAANKPKFL